VRDHQKSLLKKLDKSIKVLFCKDSRGGGMFVMVSLLLEEFLARLLLL